jgi:Zn-finger nucleic acid-binding protein
MKCPVDQTELKMADRQGVEIDYCPQCRGVWLDRGELDKIIDRQAAAPAMEREYRPSEGRWYDERRRYDYDDDDDGFGDYRGQRRRGWLGDMFDFD